MTMTATPVAPPAERTPGRPGALARWGRFVARHRWWVLAGWIVVLMAVVSVGKSRQHETNDNFSIPGTEAQRAVTILEDRFASQNNATANVMFHAPSGPLAQPQYQEAIGQVTAQLQAGASVASVSPLANAPNGTTGYVTVTFTQPVSAYSASHTAPYDQLLAAARPAEQAGLEVDFGGDFVDVFSTGSNWVAEHADLIGIGIAVVLLLLAFGSVVGMVLPIATALLGVAVASNAVLLLTFVTEVSSIAPILAVMLGLGVGIDYSLLVTTRFRQYLQSGATVEEAVGDALGTAGHAVVFAGATVIVALLGLLLVGIPFVASLGVSAAVVVGVMVVAALTLLPALMAVAGRGIDRIAIPGLGGTATKPVEQQFWGRWATAVARRPWAFLVGSVVALGVLSVPLFSMRLGLPDDGSEPATLTERRAYDLVADGFGPGFNGPLLLVAQFPTTTDGTLPAVQSALDRLATAVCGGTPSSTAAAGPDGTVDVCPAAGVALVLPPRLNNPSEADAAVVVVIPDSAPSAPATQNLVNRLKSDVVPPAVSGTPLEGGVFVGGSTATFIALTDVVTARLPWVITGVIVGAIVLLLLVFRSVLVPLKAAVMNLLAIGAAYGVIVAVFQWGWGKNAIGLSDTIPIVSFVPLMMFVILFGLSMDYEVFLMSRIKEEYVATGDPRASTVRGLALTARVITTAALIMMAVFLAYVSTPNPTIKLLGFGLAVAVLLDATVVRCVLVPAIMELLGRAAWWLPRWLHWLPRVDLDGGTAQRDRAA
jgi:RND superfamily putative drug exporter